MGKKQHRLRPSPEASSTRRWPAGAGGTTRRLLQAIALFTASLFGATSCGEEEPTPQRTQEEESDSDRESAHAGHEAGTKGDPRRDAGGVKQGRDASAAAVEADSGHDADHHGTAPRVDAAAARDAGQAAHDAGAGHATNPEHACAYHGAPDPRDALIKDDKPVVMTVGRSQDTILPQVVLDWMKEKEFAEAHDAWHLIRRWDQGCRKSNAPASGCRSAERFVSQGLWRADVQQGAPGDGYAFMAMHRHMIQMLKDSFPKHQELFAGFKRVPRARGDAENPMPWRNISWTSNNLKGFDILENIEQHLDMFPTEDDLGRYFQVTFKWSPERPTNATNEPGAGLHGALHAQWSVSGSPANLIDQKVDVRNYIFWKLHGWADDVWERYRKAKGITAEDAQFKRVMLEQCQEMIALQPSKRGRSGGDGGVPSGPSAESGVFAQQVRPILEEKCAGCHGESGAMAGVTLGGAALTSLELIDGLVDVAASNGEYKLVAAGDPDKSWLFLKASGGSATVTCSSGCDRERMPPSGAGLTAAELSALRQWIVSGATEQ